MKKLVPILRNIKKTKKAQKFINDSKKYLDYCENINAAYKIKHDELNTLMNFFATIALDLPNITVSHGYIRDMMRLFNNFESTKIDLNSYKVQQNEWMIQADKNKTEIDTKIIKYTLHREGIPEEFHTMEEVSKQQEALLQWLNDNSATFKKTLISIPYREIDINKEYTMDNELKPNGIYIYNYDSYLKYLDENKDKINFNIFGNKIYRLILKPPVHNILFISKERPDVYKSYIDEVKIDESIKYNINWDKIYTEKNGIQFFNTKDTPFKHFKIRGGIIWKNISNLFDIEQISGYDYEKKEYSKIGEPMPNHNFIPIRLPGESSNSPSSPDSSSSPDSPDNNDNNEKINIIFDYIKSINPYPKLLIVSLLELEEEKNIYLREEILEYCKFIYNKKYSKIINFSSGFMKISDMEKTYFINFLYGRHLELNVLLNEEITIETFKEILKFHNLDIINPYNNNIRNSDFDSDFINEIYEKINTI